VLLGLYIWQFHVFCIGLLNKLYIIFNILHWCSHYWSPSLPANLARLGLDGFAIGAFVGISSYISFISHGWALASFYLARMGARVFCPTSFFCACAWGGSISPSGVWHSALPSTVCSHYIRVIAEYLKHVFPQPQKLSLSLSHIHIGSTQKEAVFEYFSVFLRRRSSQLVIKWAALLRFGSRWHQRAGGSETCPPTAPRNAGRCLDVTVTQSGRALDKARLPATQSRRTARALRFSVVGEEGAVQNTRRKHDDS